MGAFARPLSPTAATMANSDWNAFVARWELRGVLGRGGSASVYRARDAEGGVDGAVKLARRERGAYGLGKSDARLRECEVESELCVRERPLSGSVGRELRPSRGARAGRGRVGRSGHPSRVGRRERLREGRSVGTPGLISARAGGSVGRTCNI